MNLEPTERILTLDCLLHQSAPLQEKQNINVVSPLLVFLLQQHPLKTFTYFFHLSILYLFIWIKVKSRDRQKMNCKPQNKTPLLVVANFLR